jgi:Tfp pilus assembly PilM family ATPase
LARFLALDWDHQHLYLVAATRRAGAVRVQNAAVFEEAVNPYSAGAPVLGQVLRDRLKDAGIAPAPVLACIGRDRLIVKDVRFPAVPPEEEPALVRFQVVKELNEPADEVVIDYFVTEDTGAGERRALAVVVRRNVVATYREMCKAAGLRLAGLVPRAFGTLACLNRQLGASALTPAPDPAGAAVAVVTVGQPWAEFFVARGEAMLFARSLAAGATLAAEVRRNLAVYAGQAPRHPVRAVYVAGSAAYVPVRERVQEPLGVPVYPLDPFGGAEQPEIPPDARGAFAGAVGLLEAGTRRTALPIDFVSPKEPRPPKSPHRLRIAAAAAAVLAGVVALGGYCYSQIADRSAKLKGINDDVAAVDQQLAKYKDDSAKLKVLEGWNLTKVSFLDELYDLTEQVPDLEKVRVVKLAYSPVANPGKDKPVAEARLQVLARDAPTVDGLNTRLGLDGHYRVHAKEGEGRNRVAQSNQFPYKSNLRFEIEKQPPEKYVRRLPDGTGDGNRRFTRPVGGRGAGSGREFRGRTAP